MKRFINKLLLFILFSIVIYVILICLWGDYAPKVLKKNLNYRVGGFIYTKIQEVKEYGDVDILFCGSSHAYRGFDPRIFRRYGLYTFNLGSSAQTPIQTEVLLHRYLDRLNPKIIVFEVCPGVFESDGVESSLNIIANDEVDFMSIEMALKQNHMKIYNTLIYAVYRNLFNGNAHLKDKITIGDDTYIKGGFVERKLHYYKEDYFEPKEFKFKAEQIRAFNRIVSQVKNRNIVLILVRAPITRSLYRSYLENHDFDELMKSYGTYYNFNEIIDLDDSLHFYNAHHLNQNGVEIFNIKLIEILRFDNKIRTHDKAPCSTSVRWHSSATDDSGL